jgi:hypothetical protein
MTIQEAREIAYAQATALKSDGQPLYPELWRGCVGAWAPCLGPTGLTLRDWSGFGNHGTLTNMDAATDWVAVSGRYILDFDGTNDNVSMSNLPATTQWSVSAWVMHRTNATIYSMPVCITFGSSASNGIANRLGNWVGMRQDSLGLFAQSQPIVTGRLYHIVATWNGTGGQLFVDGAIASGGAISDSGYAVTGTKLGDGFSTNKTNGQIDDVRVYNRVLSSSEIRLLSSRRGIAYELAPRRRASLVAAGFNRRRRLLIGAGA